MKKREILLEKIEQLRIQRDELAGALSSIINKGAWQVDYQSSICLVVTEEKMKRAHNALAKAQGKEGE